MTYDKTNNDSSASGASEHQRGPDSGPYGRHFSGGPGSDRWSWATSPGFHPLKAVAVLGGFAIAPPLGILALGYFLWNSRSRFGHQYGHGPENAQFAGGPGMERGMGHGRGFGRCGGRHMRGRFTGNAAFDQHMMDQVQKLREERRAFFEFRAAERQKRDQQAYDAFRAAQEKPDSGKDGDPSQQS